MNMARTKPHHNFRVHPAHLLLTLLLIASPALADDTPPAKANPDAVQAVTDGKRDEANAAWWGFDAKDATKTLQAAIDSGAKKVTVPNVGKPWIVRPIKLTGNQTLVFKKGVVIEAKRGAYRGKGDTLFTAKNLENLTIHGKGATWKMHKKDYQKPPYKSSEWRHALRIQGCRNVTVTGLTIASSGGDGIYVGRGKGKAHLTCRDIQIRRVKCLDNHRQGISVITAKGLVIEDSVLRGTSGTAPQAGIDFEPNHADEPLTKCVVRNCVIERNAGRGILIYLGNLDKTSEPVDITVENTTIRHNKSRQVHVIYRGHVPHGKSRIHFNHNNISGQIEVARRKDANGGQFHVNVQP